MKIKMNMIIAIMITFCFTATLFMVVPIKSANQPYNPWVDYNEDGAVSLNDLVALANSYGTTGDPTKNVTITSLNHYNIHEPYVAVGPADLFFQIFSIEGFRQVSLSVGGPNSAKHSLFIRMGSFDNITGGDYYLTFFEFLPAINMTTPPSADLYFETLAVQGPELEVIIQPYAGQNSTDWFNLAVYVTC